MQGIVEVECVFHFCTPFAVVHEDEGQGEYHEPLVVQDKQVFVGQSGAGGGKEEEAGHEDVEYGQTYPVVSEEIETDAKNYPENGAFNQEGGREQGIKGIKHNPYCRCKDRGRTHYGQGNAAGQDGD